MDEDPIGRAFAKANLKFAHAASDGNWKDWTDFKSDPPWFSEGVKLIWTVLQAHMEFWQSLTVTDYLDKSRKVLTLLADGVFDNLLADHHKRKFGESGLSRQARENFANLVCSELLPRIAVRVLSAAVIAQLPQRNDLELTSSPGSAESLKTVKDRAEAGSRTVPPVLDAASTASGMTEAQPAGNPPLIANGAPNDGPSLQPPNSAAGQGETVVRRGRPPRIPVNQDRLKGYREKLKMTLEQFAQECGVSARTIQRGEDGAGWESDTYQDVASSITRLLQGAGFNESVTPEDLQQPQEHDSNSRTRQ